MRLSAPMTNPADVGTISTNVPPTTLLSETIPRLIATPLFLSLLNASQQISDTEKIPMVEKCKFVVCRIDLPIGVIDHSPVKGANLERICLVITGSTIKLPAQCQKG